MYADYLLLRSKSAKDFCALLKTYENYGDDYDIKYIIKKRALLIFECNTVIIDQLLITINILCSNINRYIDVNKSVEWCMHMVIQYYVSLVCIAKK